MDAPERHTDAGVPLRPSYGPDDVSGGLAGRLGAPGEPPFTRGIHRDMYRGRLWTMRQYAGMGSEIGRAHV